MDFKFYCPHCGQHIATTTELIGSPGTCPTCEQSFTVPMPPSSSGGPKMSPLTKEYYYLLLEGQKKGPFTMGQLRSMWNSDSITGETLYWHNGLAEWNLLSTIAQELFTQPASGRHTTAKGLLYPPQSSPRDTSFPERTVQQQKGLNPKKLSRSQTVLVFAGGLLTILILVIRDCTGSANTHYNSTAAATPFQMTEPSSTPTPIQHSSSPPDNTPAPAMEPLPTPTSIQHSAAWQDGYEVGRLHYQNSEEFPGIMQQQNLRDLKGDDWFDGYTQGFLDAQNGK